MWIMTDGFWKRLVITAAAGGDLDVYNASEGHLGLVAAPFSPAPTLTLADLTEATYSGYHRMGMSTIGAPVGPIKASDGSWEMQFPSITWIGSSTVAVNTIYGHFLLSSDSTELMGVELFDAPIPISGPTSGFVDVVRLGCSPLTMFGKSVIAP